MKLTNQYISEIVKYSILNFLTEEENNMEIEPTVALVRQKYNEFNSKYFDNFLPKCSISVKPLGEKAGYVLGGTFRFLNGKYAIPEANVVYDPNTGAYNKIEKDTIYKVLKPVITINSKYKMPMQQLENIIIHEMCHYYTYFNEDGSFKVSDRENEHHGNDFIQAAKMIDQKSGGKIKIKSVLEAEEIEKMAASTYFEKNEYKICTAQYRGETVIWFTKYPSIWIKYMFSSFDGNIINVTNDSNVLMLLKRYGYRPLTYTSKSKVNKLDGAPSQLIDAVNKANFVQITKENYNDFFGEDD